MSPARYLSADPNQEGIFHFKSKEALERLLGHYHRPSMCIGRAPTGKNPPLCLRAIKSATLLQRKTLLTELLYANVPSDDAEKLLRSISTNMLCGVTKLHQHQAPEIAVGWSRTLMEDRRLAMSDAIHPLQCSRKSSALMNGTVDKHEGFDAEARFSGPEPVFGKEISILNSSNIASPQQNTSRKGKENEAASDEKGDFPFKGGYYFNDGNSFLSSHRIAHALHRVLPESILNDNEDLPARGEDSAATMKRPKQLVKRSLIPTALSLAKREVEGSRKREKSKSRTPRAEAFTRSHSSQKNIFRAKDALHKAAVIRAQSHKTATPVPDRPHNRDDAEDEEDEAEAGPSQVAERGTVPPIRTLITLPDGRQKYIRGSYSHSLGKPVSSTSQTPRSSPTSQSAPASHDGYGGIGRLPSPADHLELSE